MSAPKGYLHPDLRQPIGEAAISAGLKREYARLIQRLVADEPNGGYADQSQIGPLTGPQMAAVLESDENVLVDIGASRALNTALVNILADSAHTTIERCALLGAALIGVLTANCRVALLQVVQEEIERDNERKRADTADELANAARSVAARQALS